MPLVQRRRTRQSSVLLQYFLKLQDSVRASCDDDFKSIIMKNQILYWIVAFLAIGVAGYSIYGYLILEPGSTVTKAMMSVYQSHKITIMLHAFFASIALTIGVPQFNSKFRTKFPRLNLICRNIYFGSVIIGSITGLLLAFTAQGGLVNLFGFGLLAIIWMYSCIKSILSLRNNDMESFRIWIVRNYALTFAAVTLRIYLGLFFATLGYAKFDYFYPTLGFLCWVPNLIFCEWFLLSKLNKKSKT
jgi:Predicted membrane protein (DUF2306)